MGYKWIGAVLIITGCSGCGFAIAAGKRREEQATMTSLAGLVVVLMILAQKIAELFDLVKTLFQF